ncbi:cylicin-2 isoform X2 [Bactrocera oleae]|uniref:cylicin-2 isoform X2 n=1 Tax=Bactrocera oleae TaxID=104688 RepID=UPI00387E8E60
MVFDLNTTNNLPQSSTSSCKDYFYDGCNSKSQNNCHVQYQNCHCRPCCINSVVSDHTYSLLKKICRKVFRDFNRQKSREKYTIFDGGNSVNIRIHRSSLEDGKCKSLHTDSSLSTLGVTRRKYGKDRERKDDNISEKRGRDAGVRNNGEKGKLRKSFETFDTKRDRKKKGQDQEGEKHGKERKGKGREYYDNSDGTRRRDKGRGKEEDGDYYGDSKGKKGKGKKAEDGDKRSADKKISQRKKSGVNGDSDRKDGESIDDKISKKKFNKITKKREEEDSDYYSSRNIRKLDESKSQKHDGDEENKLGIKRGKNKQRDSNEYRTSIKDRDDEKMRDGVSRDEGKWSRDRNYHGNKSKDDRQKGERYDKDIQKTSKNSRDHDESKEIKKGDHELDWFNSSKDYHSDKKGFREGNHQEKGRKYIRLHNKDPDNIGRRGNRYRDNQMKGSKDGGHKDDRYSSPTNDYDTDRKGNTLKRKGVVDLPVISDLRTKVRKGHGVMPVRMTQIGKHGYSSNTLLEGGSRKKVVKHGLKQRTKDSKDRINERHGNIIKRKSRSGRWRRARFGIGYGIAISSRCDEIKPCDILRAHMEQRELCERQRSCCLQCSCDCSAIYCPAPSTICSHIC